MRTNPLFVLMLCLACQKQPSEPQLKPAPDIVPDRSAAVAEAPAATDAGYPVPSGVIALDEQKLKSFLGYQAEMIEVNTQLMKDSRQIQTPGPDGGYKTDAATLAKATALMKRENESRAKAIQGSGMSSAQIEQIERMVSEFLGQRMTAGTGNLDLMVQQLEEMMQQMPANQRAEFEQALRNARAQRDNAKNMASLRRHYGDLNVELLLAHEAELKARWQAMAAGYAGAAAH